MDKNNLQFQNSRPLSNPKPPTKTPAQNPSSLIRLRTMKDDVADAIKRQNETLVSITLAEEKQKIARRKAEELALQTSPAGNGGAPKRIHRLLVIIVLIAVVGALGFGVKFLWPTLQSFWTKTSTENLVKPETKKPKPPAPKNLRPSLIPADTERRFSVNTQTLTEISSAINADITQGIPENTVKNMSFETGNLSDATQSNASSVSINRLFSFTNIALPGLLARTLEPQFMVGLFGEAGGEATPFIILKVSDKDIALAGMLDLEPKLASFFDALFGTTLNTEVSQKGKFRSLAISGYDVRILENKSGTIAYVFANPQTILITQSKTSIEKILVLLPHN